MDGAANRDGNVTGREEGRGPPLRGDRPTAYYWPRCSNLASGVEGREDGATGSVTSAALCSLIASRSAEMQAASDEWGVASHIPHQGH